MKLRTFYMFLKPGQSKSPIFFHFWALLHQDQGVGWKEPRDSAWGVNVENTEWDARGAEGGTDRADALASASTSPVGPPALGQAKPKQQEEGLYNGSPWIMLLKKVQRETSPCAFLVTTVGRRTHTIPPFGIK